MGALKPAFRPLPSRLSCAFGVLLPWMFLVPCVYAATQDTSAAKEMPSAKPLVLPATTGSGLEAIPARDSGSSRALLAREMVGLGKANLVSGFSARVRNQLISEELEAYLAGLPSETEDTAGSEEPLSPSADPVQWSLSEASAEAGVAYLSGESKRGSEAESALPVKILDRWAVSEIENLLLSWSVPSVQVELGAPLHPGRDLLIIPPGGLAAVWKSPTAGTWLRVFVEQGGALLVCAQPQGEYFAVLPRGDEVEAVGWNESPGGSADLSREEREHSALASVRRTPATEVAIGGHFLQVPKGAEVLLKKSGSDSPVLASYPLGAGRVLISSILQDRSRNLSPTPTAEASILRDSVAWLRKPVDLPVFRSITSGVAEVSRSLQVRNFTQWPATQVTFHWIRPDGSIAHEQTKPLALMPGDESMETSSWSIPQPAATGIWFIDYSLQDARWPVQIRGLDVDSRFVVTALHAAVAKSSLPSERGLAGPEHPPEGEPRQ